MSKSSKWHMGELPYCSPYDTLKKTGGGGGEVGVGGGEGGGGGQLDGGGVGERRDVLKTHFKILKHSWYLLTNLGTGGSAPLHPPPYPSSPSSHNPPSNMHCSSSRSTVRTFTSMAADFHTLKQACLFCTGTAFLHRPASAEGYRYFE